MNKQALYDMWDKIDIFQNSRECDEACYNFLNEIKSMIEKETEFSRV
jgi:hypothetical protein